MIVNPNLSKRHSASGVVKIPCILTFIEPKRTIVPRIKIILNDDPKKVIGYAVCRRYPRVKEFHKHRHDLYINLRLVADYGYNPMSIFKSYPMWKNGFEGISEYAGAVSMMTKKQNTPIHSIAQQMPSAERHKLAEHRKRFKDVYGEVLESQLREMRAKDGSQMGRYGLDDNVE